MHNSVRGTLRGASSFRCTTRLRQRRGPADGKDGVIGEKYTSALCADPNAPAAADAVEISLFGKAGIR
jgi:hypothetical protein